MILLTWTSELEVWVTAHGDTKWLVAEYTFSIKSAGNVYLDLKLLSEAQSRMQKQYASFPK